MRHPTPRLTLVVKRCMDLLGATLGLLLTLPLWPLIMLAIRLDSPGPVFFRQLRIGRSHASHTELFFMIKFRTMRADAEAATGPVWCGKGDSRITRSGDFLRKTRLDELPQFINVLKGEMSLIGPRPERPGIANRLEDAVPYFIERTYEVAPGITGLAQVNQGYDESLDDVRSKLAFDLAYSVACSTLGAGWCRMCISSARRSPSWLARRGASHAAPTSATSQPPSGHCHCNGFFYGASLWHINVDRREVSDLIAIITIIHPQSLM